MKRLSIPLDKLAEQYRSGYSSKYLSQFYNCSVKTIQKKLREAGACKTCRLRSKKIKNNKYSINEKYFDVIDNEKKAYWLGFMLTDGSTNGSLVKLSFKKSDEYHLKKFLESVSSNHPIKQKENNGTTISYVLIANKHMRHSLIFKGIISENKKVFKVSPELEKHYWRGAIDGDGKVDSKTCTIGIAGTKEICEAFKAFCQKNVKTKVKIKKHGDAWLYQLNGNLALKLAKILYGDSSMHLDRKYQEYLNWVSKHDNKPLYPRVARFFKGVFADINLSIIRCGMPKSLEGECLYYYKNGKYLIRIDKNLNDNEAVNCLLHELSHIDTMLKQKDPHGSAFGIAYSKIYKLYESEFTI